MNLNKKYAESQTKGILYCTKFEYPTNLILTRRLLEYFKLNKIAISKSKYADYMVVNTCTNLDDNIKQAIKVIEFYCRKDSEKKI